MMPCYVLAVVIREDSHFYKRILYELGGKVDVVRITLVIAFRPYNLQYTGLLVLMEPACIDLMSDIQV
jgi:hypothetical protein